MNLTRRDGERSGAAPTVMRLAHVLGLSAATLCVLAAPARGQVVEAVTGVWVLDPARKGPHDVYGELRVVQQTGDDLGLTMVDYGSAWVAGAFREVVRIVPWTFRFDGWGPRRGPPDSAQPLTRARVAGKSLVLAKRTFSGNGEFVWAWSVEDAGAELLHRETAQPWDADFAARPPEGISRYFLRASLADSAASTALPARLDELAAGLPVVLGIVVRVDLARGVLGLSCPTHRCLMVELSSGREVGRRELPQGEAAEVPLLTEWRVEPVP